MKSRILLLSAGSIFLFSLFFFSCKKINEGTELGDDLVVDNVTTFDTSISVQTFDSIFTNANDSIKITAAAEHFVGHIDNDPLFGKTDASIFVQLKPNSVFPFKFFQPSDSVTGVHFDSVVLVLSYVETYGDTNAVQKLRVYEIDQSSPFKYDSLYLVRQNSFTYTNPISPVISFQPKNLDDSVFAIKEKAKNQLRLRLDDAFGARLLADTNMYKTDSAFNANFKGFAIVPDLPNSGNALIGVNLLDSNTKLAIYYHYDRNSVMNYDTTVRYFRFTAIATGSPSSQNFSAQAQLVQRNFAGSQLQTYLNNGTVEDDLVFLENTPGSYAKVRIPALSTLSNRVVHRAELIVQQVADPSDKTFPPPDFLYLDAYDTSKAGYRTIPFDLGFDFSGNLNAGSFGMVGRPAIVGSNTITEWRLNITRYVQHIVTNHNPNYELRLFAPNYVREIYSSNGSIQQFNVNPTVAKGRVRVGGGNHSTQKMRLRIIYSKI